MEKIHYTITKESIEDQIKSGRFNPGLEIIFTDEEGRHKHKIAAGYSDEISVFQESGITMIMSHNPKLGYAGLEVFQGNERINDVYLSGHEMDKAFGDGDHDALKMALILQEWL